MMAEGPGVMTGLPQKCLKKQSRVEDNLNHRMSRGQEAEFPINASFQSIQSESSLLPPPPAGFFGIREDQGSLPLPSFANKSHLLPLYDISTIHILICELCCYTTKSAPLPAMSRARLLSTGVSDFSCGEQRHVGALVWIGLSKVCHGIHSHGSCQKAY